MLALQSKLAPSCAWKGKMTFFPSVHADFVTSRLSDPEKVTYKKSDYENSDVAYLNQLGPKVVHKYAIVNEALAGVEEIDVRIILLNSTSDGANCLFLFYFLQHHYI